jgi:hypothetical protein
MSAVMTESPAKPATPRQLTFECKLKDSDATLELMTHGAVKDGVHQWTQLSAAVYLKPKKARAHTLQRHVRIAWAMGELSDCHLTSWTYDDTLWIRGAAFDLDRKEIPRLTEFLTSLGVAIEDNTKERS